MKKCFRFQKRGGTLLIWTIGLCVTFILLQFVGFHLKLLSAFVVQDTRALEIDVYDRSFNSVDMRVVHVAEKGDYFVVDEEGEKYKNKTASLNFRDDQTDFRIIVITLNHEKSLQRLLESLNNVYFYGDNVKIDVWIDKSKDEIIHGPTFTTAKKFNFLYGKYNVHNHSTHVGMYGQWMDTWKPLRNTQEIVVILEDDLTVSKYLYKWLRNVHKRYDKKPEICGYSLQGYSMKHGGGSGPLRAPQGNVVFTYPVIGTWGFSPKQNNWNLYLEWFKETSRDKKFKPLVPGIEPSRRYEKFLQQHKSDSMWNMWHIYYTWKIKELIVYPNLFEGRGLTINWKESGLHYSSHQMKKYSDPLLTYWNKEYDYESLPEEPVHLDVHGKVSPKDQYI